MILAFTVLVCSMQGNIFSSNFEILKCDYFDSGTNEEFYYIHTELSERCYTSIYNKWVYFSVIPSFVLYAFILPLIYFIYMYLHRDDLYQKNNLIHVGFLVNGYKSNKNFWEFLFFFRKFILNLTVIFLDTFSAATLILIILLISLYLQLKNQPFLTKKLNTFEFHSIFCAIFILMLAFFSDTMINKFAQGISIIMMFTSNSLFLIIILRIFLTIKLNELVKVKKIKILETIVTNLFNRKIFFLKKV